MEENALAERTTNDQNFSAHLTAKSDLLSPTGNESLQLDQNENSKHRKLPKSTQSEHVVTDLFPTGWRLFIIIFPLCIGTLLVAVDNTIIAVAIPEISTVFQALDDVGWYGSAYLLTETALQPTCGMLYKYFDIKAVYLISICVFERKASISMTLWLRVLIGGRYSGIHLVRRCTDFTSLHSRSSNCGIRCRWDLSRSADHCWNSCSAGKEATLSWYRGKRLCVCNMLWSHIRWGAHE